MNAPELMADKFNLLILESELPVSILANEAMTDFLLVGLGEGLPEGICETIAQRGLYFIGNIGLVQGAPKIALDCPITDSVVKLLHESYCEHVEHEANKGLQRACLERLHKLQDPRRF